MQVACTGCSDRGSYRRRLQPGEGCLEAIVAAFVGSTTDESEDVIGSRRDEPRGRQTLIPGLYDLRGRPDQDIGIPDRGDAVVEGSRNPNGDPLGIENNRFDALGFGEREEGVGHEILRISRSQIPRKRSEDLKLRLCLIRSVV